MFVLISIYLLLHIGSELHYAVLFSVLKVLFERRRVLLEKLKGERRPEVSVAAQPKALLWCSTSADFAIDFSLESRAAMKQLECYRVMQCP